MLVLELVNILGWKVGDLFERWLFFIRYLDKEGMLVRLGGSFFMSWLLLMWRFVRFVVFFSLVGIGLVILLMCIYRI